MLTSFERPIQTQPAPRIPILFRLAALITIFSMLASCATSQQSKPTASSEAQPPVAQNNVSYNQVDVRPIDIPQNLGLGGLEQAEQEMRTTLREPLREVLGADADDLFSQADEAYKAAYSYLQQAIGAQTSRPAGLAQFEVFGLTFGMMLALQSTAAKSSQETIKLKDTLELSENAKIEINVNYTKSGSKLTGNVEMKVSAGKGDSSLVETAKGKYEVDLCPDAQGHAQVKFDLNMNTSGSGGGKSAGMQFSLQGSGNGLVNDEADMTGLDLDVTSGLSHQSASAASGGQIKGEFAEVNTKVGYSNVQDAANMQAGEPSVSVTRASSAATETTVQSAFNLGIKLGLMFAYFSLYEAEKLWKDGYCLEILVDGAGLNSEVSPDESKGFTAKVHHKFEGADIEAPIVGTLSGEKSLSPLEKSNSPVQYTYQAPHEKDKEGKVKLETRSKRGAAKKDLSFKVVPLGYTVSGSIDEFDFSGTICDPKKPFTINGAGGGASAVFSFTPTADSLEGNYTYKGGGGGISLSGSGPYRILPGVNGYGTLELGGTGCVNMGACAEGTDPLFLNPLQDDSSCQ